MTERLIVLGIVVAGLVRPDGLPPSGASQFDHSQRGGVTATNRHLLIDVWLPRDSRKQPLPLLLFSPGYGNKPAQYLSQLEDLASHGFAIGAVGHPPDKLDSFEARARDWGQDIVVAKHLLLASFGQVLDADRVGVFGHSLGGRAAAAACLLDPTVAACMNQDGSMDDVRLLRPYWPISGQAFAGAFAMLDWFDPGLRDEDFRAMGKSREQYAATRLVPTPSAEASYRAVQRSALKITILTPGMRHTAFTDGPWETAANQAQKERFAGYLRQVRTITRLFFERAFRADGVAECSWSIPEIHVSCFQPQTR